MTGNPASVNQQPAGTASQPAAVGTDNLASVNPRPAGTGYLVSVNLDQRPAGAASEPAAELIILRQSTSCQLELAILHQSAGSLELPVNKLLAGTDNLAPINQPRWPAGTDNLASVNQQPAEAASQPAASGN